MQFPLLVFLRALLVLLICADKCVAVKWLALYRMKQRAWDTVRNCSAQTGMMQRQLRLCREHLELMPSLVQAALLSADTCQKQFSDRRWNCSSVLRAPTLPVDLTRGTREQAYLYALSSSAVAWSVSRSCSLGASHKCGCGTLPSTPPNGDFQWGGCGDDVMFGMVFSELFTEATLLNQKGKSRTSKKAMMNRHNFKAGRQIVADSMTRACKCHGVSGSCSIKTCWRSLPVFDSIGATLKERYALAVEVKRKKVKKEKVLVPIHGGRSHFRDDELVYCEKSPDYCSPDPKTGSVGTMGRLCEATGGGSRHCESMCCGRGHDNFTMEITERCECKYYWCCYVKCKTCVRTLYLNQCR